MFFPNEVFQVSNHMQHNHHYNTSANQAEQPMPKERILDSSKQIVMRLANKNHLLQYIFVKFLVGTKLHFLYK